MKKLVTLSLVLLAHASVLAPDANAQDNTCRTRCEVNEVIDARGCCAPLRWNTSTQGTLAPPSIEEKLSPKSINVATHLRAYYFTAKATWGEQDQHDEIELVKALTKRLKDDAHTLTQEQKVQLIHEQVSHIWNVWLQTEASFLFTLEQCAQSDTPMNCTQELNYKHKERQTWQAIAAPLLNDATTSLSTTLNTLETQENILAQATFAQALYYRIAMALSVNQTTGTVDDVKTLIRIDKDSPYAALAATSMADYYLGKNSFKEASKLYLQAISHTYNPTRAYAMYRQAQCQIQSSDWSQGMRMLIMALEETEKQAHTMPQANVLSKEIMLDIISLYAQTGAVPSAPDFFIALGVPEALVPSYLSRLADAYDEVGRVKEAKALRDALAQPE